MTGISATILFSISDAQRAIERGEPLAEVIRLASQGGELTDDMLQAICALWTVKNYENAFKEIARA